LRIGEVKTITVQRNETNFDKACDSAWETAINQLGVENVDEHNVKVVWEYLNKKGWPRDDLTRDQIEEVRNIQFHEDDNIILEFKSFRHVIEASREHSLIYVFAAWIERTKPP